MAHTTIAIDPTVRDELRQFGKAGDSYNDILRRLMDEARLRAFVADLRRIYRETPDEDWIDLEDL